MVYCRVKVSFLFQPHPPCFFRQCCSNLGTTEERLASGQEILPWRGVYSLFEKRKEKRMPLSRPLPKWRPHLERGDLSQRLSNAQQRTRGRVGRGCRPSKITIVKVLAAILLKFLSWSSQKQGRNNDLSSNISTAFCKKATRVPLTLKIEHIFYFVKGKIKFLPHFEVHPKNQVQAEMGEEF